MKKLLFLVMAVIILGAVYLVLSKDTKEKTSITVEDREFVVENADDIHVITIKSKTYPLMHLSRAEGYWILNDKYKANPTVIKNMLGALTNMKIKYIPPRSQNKMIEKSIENVGIEIKTFDRDGKVLSDFIMAGNTNDESGTYCIKRGAQQAYVMSMPIVEGGLRNFFNMTQVGMRDKTIFSFDPQRIKSIEIDYLKDRKNSFRLEKSGSEFTITATGRTGKPSAKANKNLAYAYVNDYDKLMAEVINQENPDLDKLEGRLPFAVFTITTDDKASFEMEIFPDLDIFDRTINTRSVDDLAKIERYFVKTSDGEDYIVQQRLIGKCLKKYEYFDSSSR